MLLTLLRGASLASALLLTFIASSSQAIITKGDPGHPDCISAANCPYLFDDNAFSDGAFDESGPGSTVTGSPDIFTALADQFLNTVVSLNPGPPTSTVVLFSPATSWRTGQVSIS